MKMYLNFCGFEVEIATNVKSALETASRSEFDILVCDLNLPDGTGWDLMLKLREKRDVCAIAFSAFDEPEHVARSKAVGFEEHVVKTSTPESLVEAIKRVLGRRSARRGAVT